MLCTCVAQAGRGQPAGGEEQGQAAAPGPAAVRLRERARPAAQALRESRERPRQGQEGHHPSPGRAQPCSCRTYISTCLR